MGMADRSDLPGALPALARSLRLAYRAEPRLLVASIALIVISSVPDTLNALWLKLLADGVVAHRDTEIVVAACGLAAAIAGAWLLRTIANNFQLLFRERATVAIEAHVARLQAKVAGLELHERPEYLDRLQVLKSNAALLNRTLESFIGLVGLLVRLALIIGLLASIHPLLVLLVLFAGPTATASMWRSGAERQAQERAAPHLRLARHLFDLGTTAGPGKELRVSGAAAGVVSRWRREWMAATAPLTRARWVSALWYTAAWTLFGAAYVGAIAVAAFGASSSPGNGLLVLAAGGSLTAYLGQTLSAGAFLRFTLDAGRRMVWLEDYVSARREVGDQPSPERFERGIQVEHVSFSYPGTERLVLQAVSLDLPAGTVVALVGENGAGKSTLVKLLCGLYQPSRGRILVEGTDLARIPSEEWRAHVAGAFQDFVRFEFRAMRTVGLGDLPRQAVGSAVETAVARGGATDVIEHLPHVLETL